MTAMKTSKQYLTKFGSGEILSFEGLPVHKNCFEILPVPTLENHWPAGSSKPRIEVDIPTMCGVDKRKVLQYSLHIVALYSRR